MRSWTRGWWCTLVVAVFMTTTAGAQVVLESSPGATGATRVRAWVQGPELQLADARTGEPVAAPDIDERAASSGGRLLWAVESDSIDELGMRHVILRQRLRPAPGSVTLPGGMMRDGVPLHGSLVGLHYDPEGNLKVVGASIFEDAATVGGLALLTPDHAYEMAAWGLSHRDDLAVDALELLSPEAAAAIRRDARLELFSRGDGRSFDFVWTVPVVDVEGRAHSARVHGATGELLQSWEGALPWSGSEAPGLIPGFEKQPKTIVGPSCYPTPIPTAVTATVLRQRDLESQIQHPRTIGLAVSASPVLSAWYGQGVTHQAMTAAGGSFPEIRVFSGWPSGDGETQCTLPEALSRSRDLRLVPLTTDGGSPVFEDLRNIDGDVDIPGRAAGDALYHTRAALAVLAGLGWAGFSGGLDIVVNSWDFADGAGFVRPVGYGNKNQTDRDGIHFHHHSADATEERFREPLFKSSTRFMYSAAQDVVAHEIGHGVITNLGTGWVRDPFYGGMTWEDVMHEAWADVIGLIVEWATQESGGGPETADWFAGEDTFVTEGADAWDRRWDDYDDGDDVGYSLHALDDAGLPSDPDDEPWAYYTSNRLPLAFRLSVTGGRNPVCNRSADVRRYWTGCEVGSFSPQFCAEHSYFCPPEPGAPPGSLGSDFSVVGRPVAEMSAAFFRALHVYWMYMDDWDSVADFVKVAAHDLFRSLPGGWPAPVCDDAFAHQIAVAGAFRSVGYEGSGGWVCMCENPCSPPVAW